MLFQVCTKITLISLEIVHLIGTQNIQKKQNFLGPNAHQRYVYQGIRNVRFLECFVQVLNRRSLTWTCDYYDLHVMNGFDCCFIFRYHCNMGCLVIELYFSCWALNFRGKLFFLLSGIFLYNGLFSFVFFAVNFFLFGDIFRITIIISLIIINS